MDFEGTGSKLDGHLHRCPWPGCINRTRAFMCPPDWEKLEPANRRAIVAELKLMKSRGQRQVSKALHAAFIEALRQAIKTGKLEVPR